MRAIQVLLGVIFLLLGPPDNGIAQELPPPNILARALKDYTFHKAKASKGDIITIIDFGLPIEAKRLWVFDVPQKKALFHTKVAHAGGSGESCASVFSDTEGSRLSCVGVFRTAEDYTGVFGYSMRVDGLSASNKSARKRAIVFHPDPEITYSWGCFMLPPAENRAIINRIKGGSLVFVYP